jgi:ankyrin repeat protein
MATSHEKRRQHLSLAMYHAKQGPKEVIEFIEGLILGDLDKVAKHIKTIGGSKKTLGSRTVKVDIKFPVLENTAPLFLACQGRTRGHALIVRHLIKRGAPTRDKKTGRTGLHRACSANAVEVAKELLGLYPTSISASSFDGSTPLSLSTRCNAIDCVRLLIKRGVDPDERSVHKSTALFIAAATNNFEILDLLLTRTGANPEIINQDGQTPLFTAAAQGYEKIANTLLDIPLSVSCVNASVNNAAGQTALIAASRGAHVTIVELLLEKGGADVDRPDNQGRTALYAASQEGHVATVKALLQHGADLEMLTTNGSTPLSVSAQEGHLLVFEELLNAGADIMVRDMSGRSLFEIACIGGHGAVLGSLVKHGARDKKWRLPIYLRSQAKRADERGKKKGIEMRQRHKETLKEVDLHLRVAKAMNEDALRQCAKATEMAIQAAEYAEQAKNGLGKIHVHVEQSDKK